LCTTTAAADAATLRSAAGSTTGQLNRLIEFHHSHIAHSQIDVIQLETMFVFEFLIAAGST
jgi:hypothetical protein